MPTSMYCAGALRLHRCTRGGTRSSTESIRCPTTSVNASGGGIGRRARWTRSGGKTRPARCSNRSRGRGTITGSSPPTGCRRNTGSTTARWRWRPKSSSGVAQMGGTRRALELLALGRKVDARREWRALTRDLEEEELAAASWFAQCRDWHGRAILTIARTAQQDDLKLRFPIEFSGIVESASRRRSLSPADDLRLHPPGERVHTGCPFRKGRARPDADPAEHRAHAHANTGETPAQSPPASRSEAQRRSRNRSTYGP